MQRPIVRGRRPNRPRVSYRSRALYTASWLAGHSLFRLPRLSPRSISALQRLDALAARVPPPRNTAVEPVPFDGYDAEWVRAHHATDDGAVLYFHGGGFFFCGLNTHRPAVASISAKTKLPVLSVAYRQLPETPIPGSVEDCLRSYQYLLAEGIPANKIVFAGDSAGGYLTFATALRARDAGLPLPVGIVAVSPLLDIDTTTRMQHANWRRDTYIPVNRMPDLTKLWNGGADGQRPISPVNEDLAGLPPSLIMAAESEVLLCDAEVMANRLWEVGTECTLQVWHGQVHAFPVLAGFCPETKVAIGQIAQFIRKVTKLD